MKTREPQPLPPATSAKSRLVRSRLWLLILLLLIGGGVVVWRAFTPASDPSSPATTQEPPPRPVETVAIAQGKAIRRIRLLGQVEASKTATIRTQTAGTVERVFVEVGDRVTPGTSVRG